MIDYFALALSHFLIVIALVRMLARADLDRDETPITDDQAAPGPQA